MTMAPWSACWIAVAMASRNDATSATLWSAGVTTSTASPPSPAPASACSAATVSAGAVLRPHGSDSTRAALPARFIMSVIMKRCSSPQTTICAASMPSGRPASAATPARRLAVASSSVSSAIRFSNCLGNCSRDSGHRRVPAPPARITGCTTGNAAQCAALSPSPCSAAWISPLTGGGVWFSSRVRIRIMPPGVSAVPSVPRVAPGPAQPLPALRRSRRNGYARQRSLTAVTGMPASLGRRPGAICSIPHTLLAPPRRAARMRAAVARDRARSVGERTDGHGHRRCNTVGRAGAAPAIAARRHARTAEERHGAGGGNDGYDGDNRAEDSDHGNHGHRPRRLPLRAPVAPPGQAGAALAAP
ncbi:protein of unknown function (plasmid) [Cupriavidus neocaledonicus]|uniref:Uncharacterized protein n=1 Tax=Cupriavidus neocaledonicus TaxID=1040979 RepID=A0A375HX01_9BURK|nr:hypothetical protein CBM2605_B10129 [Cupriavidus neocaledonicus]SPD61237.1 protein of unknown function [Cupriavidus neocaledonicus]